MRDQIWKNFQNSLFKSFILDEMIKVYQERERWTNVILAFASSASIVTWAIWDKVPLLWGGIIAAPIVIMVIKSHFPYSKYRKEIHEKKYELTINLVFEKLWYKV